MKIEILNSNHSLPLLVKPDTELELSNLDNFLSWYRDNSEFLSNKLLKDGAILFQGFGVNTIMAFEKFLKLVSGNLMDYVDGNSPRTQLTTGIYTSTEYPAKYSISLHNELSYSSQWPSQLYFCCITAPKEGGETPIADSRQILKSLNPKIIEKFTLKQVKYIRNLHGGDGMGVSWQDSYKTSDSSLVEEYNRKAGIDFEWKKDGGLRLSQIRPAIAIHPHTGEQVWFNQAEQFHPSSLPKNIYEAMMFYFDGSEGELPQYACFGDNTPIDVSMLDEIREATCQQAVVFPWQEGDVLAIDNMLVCHGRTPFVGSRKILVSMSHM
ncbi:MAG: TauD/TfdA family dioxygenase [Chroococcidiopsidaceae cyanobacterium CP_BM_RX_35]|nr:TauD/TfdA family dioxygenase [Chroococcidiopsidaceae cyanobacterium CP_BM_RX_35]